MRISLMNMIVFFIAIQAALVMVSIPNLEDSANLGLAAGNASNYSLAAPGYGNVTTSDSIWQLIVNPQDGISGTLFAFLMVLAISIGVISLVAKVDAGIWAGVFVLLLGFGSVPISNLYNFLNSEVANYACGITPGLLAMPTVCWPAEFLSMIVCGLLYIFWVWGCIQWWSNRNG